MARRRDIEYEEEEYEEEEYVEPSLLEAFSSASLRRVVLIPLILILFSFGAWVSWKKYSEEVLGHVSYRLDPNHIQFTDPPEFLENRNILEEVVKLGSLESKKSHESGLTVQVANAFELHPWVREVSRVRIDYPAKLHVEVSYRRPVAAVVFPFMKDGEPWIDYYPIDADSVLLPSEDFTSDTIRSFPRIDVGNTAPVGLSGTEWGDEMVADAAKIAELLYEEWADMQDVLYQIERSAQPTSTSGAADFDIRGRPELEPGGLLVHWGRAPGNEQAGEPTAEAKFAKLKQWVSKMKISPQTTMFEIDLRRARTQQATVVETTRQR